MNLNDTVMYASSPGGHFAQLLALHELFDKYQTIIVTNNQSADYTIPELKNVYAIERITNNRGKLSQKSKGQNRLQKIPFYCQTFKDCYKAWKKYKPKVIVSTGSNIAIPFCLIGKLFGSKFVFIESRAKVYSKTATGKAIGRIADVVLVQWTEMVDVYGKKAKYLGTLV